MSIEIGQVIIQCDRCLACLVHDPSPDPLSDFTRTRRWTSKDAVAFAIKNGWSIEYDPNIKDFWADCPSCVSEGKVVLKDKQMEQSLDDEYPGMGGS